jgi:hypothetical protein
MTLETFFEKFDQFLSPFVGGIERNFQIMLRGTTGFILTSLVNTGMTVQSLQRCPLDARQRLRRHPAGTFQPGPDGQRPCHRLP